MPPWSGWRLASSAPATASGTKNATDASSHSVTDDGPASAPRVIHRRLTTATTLMRTTSRRPSAWMKPGVEAGLTPAGRDGPEDGGATRGAALPRALRGAALAGLPFRGAGPLLEVLLEGRQRRVPPRGDDLVVVPPAVAFLVA